MIDFNKIREDRQLAADGKFEELLEDRPVIAHRKPAQGETAIPCIVIHETGKAILVRIANQGADEDTPKEYWFPLSHTSYIFRKHGYLTQNSEYTDMVYVSSWLITKKGIEL